jgi:hypothetical protein
MWIVPLIELDVLTWIVRVRSVFSMFTSPETLLKRIVEG